jgi:hypothetical protein
MHGGPLPQEREVPLVWLPGDAADVKIELPTTQLGVCGFMRDRLLGSTAA